MNTKSFRKLFNDTHQSFSEDYLRDEVAAFRQLWSDDDFCKNEQKQDAAIHGLWFVYFNTVPEGNLPVTHEHIERWARMVQTTLIEFERRKTLKALSPARFFRGMERPDCPECQRPQGVAPINGRWMCYCVAHKEHIDCGPVIS